MTELRDRTGLPPTPAGPGADRTQPVTVSAVIVTWNCRGDIVDCLDSLAANGPNLPWEAIVIDNGSTDGTTDAVRDRAPWARLIANPGNRGLAAANNQGMLAARGDLFLIANPDTVWRPGAVDALVAAMGRHPRAAWVVPRLLYEDGRLQTSAGDLPTFSQALLGRQLSLRRRHPGPTAGHHWDTWSHDREQEIGRGAEAAYLVRRAAVEEVGVQDEGFVLDWEGPEWTARLRAAGWEVWLCPDAEVVHRCGTSIRQVTYRWIVSSHRGLYRYLAPQAPRAARPLLGAAIAARAGAKMGLTALGVGMYHRGNHLNVAREAD